MPPTSASASASSTWPFCPSCRATLRVDSGGSIECKVCPYRSNLDDMAASASAAGGGTGADNNTGLPFTVTYSADRPTPLWAKTDEEQERVRRASDVPVRATVEEPCVKCGHPEVGYYTVQLRSVDEGQTVFYECPSCKHTWSINN
jgi:DNA-directed RNA polymerase I subunit RPA12